MRNEYAIQRLSGRVGRLGDDHVEVRVVDRRAVQYDGYLSRESDARAERVLLVKQHFSKVEGLIRGFAPVSTHPTPAHTK